MLTTELCRYDKARQIKNAQDAFCVQAEAGQWDSIGDFPEEYQWEALVDVLRGRVKVCSSELSWSHCTGRVPYRFITIATKRLTWMIWSG